MVEITRQPSLLSQASGEGQKKNRLWSPESAKARAHMRDLSMVRCMTLTHCLLLCAPPHAKPCPQRFIDADVDCSGTLTYEEFITLLPESVRQAQDDATLHSWFHAADQDHSGRISKDEFFHMSLSTAVKKTGSGLGAIFRSYDKVCRRRPVEPDDSTNRSR
jgi:hypothetical protein